MLAILSEAVVRAHVGTTTVMRKQLEHLLNLVHTGVCGGASGPFRLIDLRDRSHERIVEAIGGSG